MNTFKEPLSAQEEKYYLEQLKKGSKDARDILIERNLRLVAHIAKKYSQEEQDVEELISIGTIGLIKAINTFDAGKGSRLVTYAAKCIDNELLMMLRSRRKRRREVSLYEPIGTDREGNSISLLDIMESDSEDIIDGIEREENIGIIKELVETVLTEREKQIIKMRYGMDCEPLTQRDVGSKLGISRSYVSRIEKRAVEKLRKSFNNY